MVHTQMYGKRATIKAAKPPAKEITQRSATISLGKNAHAHGEAEVQINENNTTTKTYIYMYKKEVCIITVCMKCAKKLIFFIIICFCFLNFACYCVN